jgi:hypothetical protein
VIVTALPETQHAEITHAAGPVPRNYWRRRRVLFDANPSIPSGAAYRAAFHRGTAGTAPSA